MRDAATLQRDGRHGEPFDAFQVRCSLLRALLMTKQGLAPMPKLLP
jgi:hypothetical protein